MRTLTGVAAILLFAGVVLTTSGCCPHKRGRGWGPPPGKPGHGSVKCPMCGKNKGSAACVCKPESGKVPPGRHKTK
jgi:hypothetical protein